MRRVGRSLRGMTLVEIMLTIGLIAMVSVLIYGTFQTLGRGRQMEQRRAERTREGRQALDRITREMQSAYISMHQPANVALVVRNTGFVSAMSGDFARVDFTSFAHRRLLRDAKESDQAEVSYFTAHDDRPQSRDRSRGEKLDLVRREQTPIDTDFRKGGIVQVLAEGVKEFRVKFFEPSTGQWIDRWDSTQTNMQFGRIPIEVRVTLVLMAEPPAAEIRLTTKFMLPLVAPLGFGMTTQ